MKHSARNLLGLVTCLAACYAAAVAGGLFTVGSIGDWYSTLAKPAWTPPAWLFGPVWTVLYGLMAVSVWLVWLRRGQQPVRWPIMAFTLQLILNAAWSPLFFGLHSPGIALVDIAALWTAIVVTVCLFFRARVVSGILMLPYVLWVSFAAALNFAIWQLNA